LKKAVDVCALIEYMQTDLRSDMFQNQYISHFKIQTKKRTLPFPPTNLNQDGLGLLLSGSDAPLSSAISAKSPTFSSANASKKSGIEFCFEF